MEPRWLSPRTAAVYLDCKVRTVYAWASDGTIPAVRITRRNPKGKGRHRVTIRLDKLALDAFLQRRQS
jgi:excisionase family DNA binding protein